MRYRLPIGEDDFAQVRLEYYFVDKSPFIREFMTLWQDIDALDAQIFL